MKIAKPAPRIPGKTPEMKPKTEPHSYELMIIGAGMTGTAAALFAARHGISTVQAGLTGETLYASGLFDLYGVSHGPSRTLIDDPWQGLNLLKRDTPEHPFSRLSPTQIRSAMDQLTQFLESVGHPYLGHADKNVRLITPVGSIKRTYRVPATMWAGVLALETKAPCLIVDIIGLRGFSAAQVVGTLKSSWPALKAASIDLPWEHRLGPKYAEHIARGLEVADARRDLADAIRPHLKKEKYVGLPAVLGIHDTEGVRRDLEQMLGRPVFEIPTMPPAIAGVRLKEIFEIHLPRLGVKTHFHQSVLAIHRLPDGRFSLAVGQSEPETTLVADNLLLATGRFLGKGLVAGRQGIREALMDLPVVQPADRSGWHREAFLDPRGHAINMAGLAVDDCFRPLTSKGRPVFANLYAAGSILAHQDWMRTKSGTGLAVATAHGAIEALKRSR
jgi:glycerol-3-phosphate dehydrogenase subunit B